MEFPYGTLTTLPEGLLPPECWPEFGQIAYPPRICKREEIEGGIRWCLWPLCFEQYIGDSEPEIEKNEHGSLAYNRLALWKRIARTDIPPGWKEAGTKPWRVDGFFTLSSEEDFSKRWSKTEQRHIRTWLREKLHKTHTLEEITFTEFYDAYTKSSVAKKFGLDLLYILERKYKTPTLTPHITLLGVRDRITGLVVAGTAYITSPTYKASVLECRFMLPTAKNTHAMTALMYEWFLRAQKNSIQYLFFCFFWYPGAPKTWKGFSEYKSYFGLSYVAYPPELRRFVRGKFL